MYQQYAMELKHQQHREDKMGRRVSLGVYPSQGKTLIGAEADRPATSNPGVQFYNQTRNQLEIYNGQGWHAVRDTLPVVVSSSGSVVSNRHYWVNTAGGAVTLTLPASPAQNDIIRFTDIGGAFDSNALTINRNGKRIQRLTDDMTVDTEGASLTLMFYDDTNGWLLKTV